MKSTVSNFIKIRPVGAELFHADSRTDGSMDEYMTNFANAHKKDSINQNISSCVLFSITVIS